MALFDQNQSFEKKIFIHSLIFPFFLALIMFFLKLVEYLEGTSFAFLGIYPLDVKSLGGILLTPLIHGDWGHLISNLFSFLVLSISLFYFYRGIAYRTFFIIYICSGIFVWLFGRESYHIGASGVIYGLAAFLLFSGIIRNHIPLMAISLMVIFLYGSMVWGIFPLHINLPYSWEAHLGGTITGLILAIILRNKGPQRKVKVWDDEDGTEDFSDFENMKISDH